ncbi:MAG: hypothetical protein QF412_02140, partial [Planctomycetota bacterium]|nr:hypothetical protein [Planctomycetota bacterium]
VAASHHVFTLGGLRSLSSPVKAKEIWADHGRLETKEDGTYTLKLKLSKRGESSDPYLLSKNGVFMVLADQGSRRPKRRYLGAYGLDGETGHYHFSDRHQSSSDTRVGLWMGTKLAGTYTKEDVKGDWHIFSQHVILPSSSSFSAGEVGRSVAGSIAIDENGAVTGSGTESTSATLTFTGSAATFTDGKVTLTLDYKPAQSAGDERDFFCGADDHPTLTKPGVIIGIDDKDDGEAGVIGLIRERTGTADKAKLAGRPFLIGVNTIFVTANREGMDGATGTLEFDATDSFTIAAVGAIPPDTKDPRKLSYGGTYTLADDGELTLTLKSPTQIWKGAVDQDYKTVILVDHYIEQTSSSEKSAELNFFFGLRQAEDPSK